MSEERRRPGPTRLVPVDDRNRVNVLKLRVKTEQVGLVASTAKSLRQADAKAHLAPRAFLEGDRVVGFAMYDRLPDGSAYIWRVMIGEGDQGRGLGKLLMDAVVAEIRRSGAKRARISHRPENRVAAHLFEEFGFEEVDFELDGEVVRELWFVPKPPEATL